MTKIYSCLASLLCGILLQNVCAQWAQINTGSTDDYIHVSFINDSTGVLASNQVLMLTKNYGDTWDSIYFNVDDNIGDVQFLNDSTVYFIGYPTSGSQFLKKTFDLGSNWSTENSSGGYEKIFFTSIDTGHLFAQNIVLNTIDGGDIWTEGTIIPSSINFLAGNIYFTTASTGYFVGWYNMVVYKSIDSGVSWELKNIPSGADAGLDIYFPSLEVGYTCGHDGGMLKTTDSGNNWISLNTSITDFRDLYSLYCPSNNSCYSVGDDGTILKTTDGGENWLPETSGITESLRSVYCTSKYCYAVGDNGVVLRTANTLGVISNDNANIGVSIFPNPNNGKGTLVVSGINDPYKFEVFDVSGKLVFTQENILTKEFELNLEHASGYYTYKVTADNMKPVVGKLIVE